MPSRARLSVILVLVVLSWSPAPARAHMRRSWSGRGRWKRALADAARAPATWVPAAAAAGVAAGGWDQEISGWARRETPVFGSRDGAKKASDDLLVATQLALLATIASLPATELPGGSRPGCLLGEETVLAVNAGITAGVKALAGRERPNGANNESFPSGHSSGAFAATAIASRNLRHARIERPTRRFLDAGLFTLSAGTAWARVEAGAHYPVDTLAGAALGNFVSVTLYDVFLETERPPMVSLDLTPGRQAIYFHLSFR